MLRPGAAQRDVGVPPRQVGEIETGYDFQRNAGAVAPKIGQPRRDKVSRHIFRGSETHAARGAPIAPAGFPLDRQNRFLDIFGFQTNGLAALGQAVSGLAAIKQTRAEFGFEFGDAAADSGGAAL